ncbi:hypothetical protein J437_LFUL002361 [Ladona fulva]|uniref:HIT domain-containing protein n=1 Tax=Ladona fulva TaxID=123851 RepID=A0A8K0K4E0_LADFU|nr:hypothetical protein J437_LFUL002361 [Ladona fulva]
MGTKRSSNDHSPTPPKKSSNHWSQGLLSSMENPSLKVEEDEDLVVIKDKYPKAEVHYLILPKDDISSLRQVKSSHLSLFYKMEKCGKKLISEHPNHKFRLGFHAVPSMARLHLHVISQDFNSPCLKTKRHWNSFTTPYFLPISSAISELESKGEISKMPSHVAESYLTSKLKCHVCSFEPKTMPELKRHLFSHIGKEAKK